MRTMNYSFLQVNVNFINDYVMCGLGLAFSAISKEDERRREIQLQQQPEPVQ